MRLKVLITTSTLTQVQQATGYDYREKLIYKLSKGGMTNRKIVDYLENKGIRPKRTSSFSTKLVWSILKKYKNKMQRKIDFSIRIVSF